MLPFPSKSPILDTQDRHSHPLHPDTFSTHAPKAPSPALYDDKGRQKRFVEDVEQRRQRVEFLRRKEWTRRIAAWIDQSGRGARAAAAAAAANQVRTHARTVVTLTSPSVPALTHTSCPQNPTSTTFSWEDLLAAHEPEHAEDDAEPYVIYTASPRSPSSSSSSSSLCSLVDPPSPATPVAFPTSRSPGSAAPGLNKLRWTPHSRHSSLTSISEEEDESKCVL